jgi:hypothetical protein
MVLSSASSSTNQTLNGLVMAGRDAGLSGLNMAPEHGQGWILSTVFATLLWVQGQSHLVTT